MLTIQHMTRKRHTSLPSVQQVGGWSVWAQVINGVLSFALTPLAFALIHQLMQGFGSTRSKTQLEPTTVSAGQPG
jgi:hypothetical protein